MRPWFAMKVAGIPFEDEVISLNAPDFKERLLKVSGTGKVPTLIDGDVRVWESLAILEYLAEKFPAARAVAGGCQGARPCPGHLQRDACGLHSAPPGLPDEFVAAGEEDAA